MKTRPTSEPLLTRRRFIGEAGCAALSSVSILSTLANLQLANRAVAETLSTGQDERSLVCIFLFGGNDSFNLLVPRGPQYAEYAETRSNLALSEASLLPLNLGGPTDGRSYGLHPSTPEIQELFNGLGGDPAKRRLAFLANVGTLIQPTTLAQYQSEQVPLPKALFSHSDQTDQWQTSVPQGLIQLTGWAGRAADLLHSTYNSSVVSMGISLAGNNLFQTGNNTRQFALTRSGSIALSGPPDDAPNNPVVIKNRALRSLMEQHYSHLLAQSFASVTKSSLDAQRVFQTAFEAFDNSRITTPFPANNDLAEQLRVVVRVIAIRRALGLRRQTFFVSAGGYDNHFELLDTHRGLLRGLSAAIGFYQKALDELNLQDSVLSFTASDFGRTLRSNSRGTDHAWGGNAMVFGGGVRGGRIYGRYPSLALDGPDDVGYGGRILPSTSVDAFFAEMLRWFGVTAGNMPYVLPNIRNFHDPASATLPVGFLKNV